MKRRHSLIPYHPERITRMPSGHTIHSPELHPPAPRVAHWETVAIAAICPIAIGLFAYLVHLLR